MFVNSRLRPVLCCFTAGFSRLAHSLLWWSFKTSCSDQRVVWTEGGRLKDTFTEQVRRLEGWEEGWEWNRTECVSLKFVLLKHDWWKHKPFLFLLFFFKTVLLIESFCLTFFSLILRLKAPDLISAHSRQNYTIKDLLPFTVYRASVACKEDYGILSDWSSDITARTLERGNSLQSHRAKNPMTRNLKRFKYSPSMPGTARDNSINQWR